MADDAVDPDRPQAVEPLTAASLDPEIASAAGSGPSYDEEQGFSLGLNLSFRTRLTVGLIAAAVLPAGGLRDHRPDFGQRRVGRGDARSDPALHDRHGRARRRAPRLPSRGRPHRTAPGDRGGRRPGLGRRPLDADRRPGRRRARPPGRQPQPPRRDARAAKPGAGSHPGGDRERLAARWTRVPRGSSGDRRALGIRDDRLPNPPRGSGPDRRGGADPGRVAPRQGGSPDGRGGAGRARRASAGDPCLGASRPGPARAVCERDRCGNPECAAVRDGRGPEHPAPRARCRQGRLPPRRQPQPPDATDQHPRLRPPDADRPTGPPAGNHRRAVGAAAAGWSASC